MPDAYANRNIFFLSHPVALTRSGVRYSLSPFPGIPGEGKDNLFSGKVGALSLRLRNTGNPPSPPLCNFDRLYRVTFLFPLGILFNLSLRRDSPSRDFLAEPLKIFPCPFLFFFLLLHFFPSLKSKKPSFTFNAGKYNRQYNTTVVHAVCSSLPPH